MNQYKRFWPSFIFLLSSSFLFSQEADSTSVKKTELNEVVVTKKKQAVIQKADRTIFDFSEQSHLNWLCFRRIEKITRFNYF